jgi:hypothetical protein
MKPDGDEEKNANLATMLASIAMDTAKLVTGVPLDYPDPFLTPLATVPQPAKEEANMDDEKDKPLVDQMTDVSQMRPVSSHSRLRRLFRRREVIRHDQSTPLHNLMEADHEGSYHSKSLQHRHGAMERLTGSIR